MTQTCPVAQIPSLSRTELSGHQSTWRYTFLVPTFSSGKEEQFCNGIRKAFHTSLSAMKSDCSNTVKCPVPFFMAIALDTETHKPEEQPAVLRVVALQCVCVFLKLQWLWWGTVHSRCRTLPTGWPPSHRVTAPAQPLHAIQHCQSHVLL